MNFGLRGTERIYLKSLEHDNIRIIKVPSYKKGDLAQLDRLGDENPKCCDIGQDVKMTYFLE